ncbi:MAG: HDIG domain-containing protein [Spirochaetia bacterium]|nr:HDIG domain-containing protein [Spirochaetia bacterium]
MKKKQKQKQRHDRHDVRRIDQIILITLLLLAVLGISLSDVFQHRLLSEVIDKSVLGLQSGEIASKDIIAEEAVYYIDSKETEKLQDEAIGSIYPVFRVSLVKSIASLEMLHTIKAIFLSQTLSDEEKTAQLSQKGIDDKFVGSDLQTMFTFDTEQLNFLFQFVEELLIDLFEQGVYDKRELALAGSPSEIKLIRVDSSGKSSSEIVSVDTLLTRDRIPEYLTERLKDSNDLLKQLTGSALKLVVALVQENVIYDSITTQIVQTEARQSILPVIKTIEKGELIVKEGFLVTENALEKIRALEQVAVSQTGVEIAGRVSYYLLVTLLFAVTIYKLIAPTIRRRQFFYMITSMVLIYIVLYFVLTMQLFDRNLISVEMFTPIVVFTMLLTIIIDRRVSLAAAGYLTLLAVSIPEVKAISMLYILAVGVAGAIVVDQAKRRIDLIRSAALVSLISVLLALGAGMIRQEGTQWFSYYLAAAGIVTMLSGTLIVIVLPILEHVFNLPTVFRLAELTTSNPKVMKLMAMKARGTYSHSVAVADLAETACEAIGANHLLARVGAYYHDIGKLDQPEYFIENQSGDNKHDDLTPSLSAVVIKAHVKVGVERAKSIGLPQEVIDIIAQHHGSDVISYFYREALLKNEKGSRINPSDFSYSGHPPVTREAAVVMLADIVDAASRTIKQPTNAKLDKLIWKIFTEKIDHKQLNYCDLSIRDLETIKNSFIMILSGRFHDRIEYHDQMKERRSH